MADREMVFTSFALFGAYLGRMRAVAGDAISVSMEDVGLDLLDRVQSRFGEYPDEDTLGPFPEWAELSEATLERRARRGINPEDEPLLEAGNLRDSYKVVRTGSHEVTVGSESPYAGIQEVGGVGSNGQVIPPRPVLGPSIWEMEQENEIDAIRDIFKDICLQGRRVNIRDGRLRYRRGYKGYGDLPYASTKFRRR